MSRYKSVDALQNMLAEQVFKDTTSPKKAAGRALGTLVELITFYLIRDWGLENSLAIERGLPEYGNADITHNVEFSLHPASNTYSVKVSDSTKSLTPKQIENSMKAAGHSLRGAERKKSGVKLLSGDLLRHAAVFAEDAKSDTFWTASMTGKDENMGITELYSAPFAMFECKRVGVEEGMKKGPQTIEKAKQGAYVARAVSGLQRVPLRDGRVAAVVEDSEGNLQQHDSYYDFLRSAIDNRDQKALKNIVLTIGVVSNHGNWFTSETQNKEMRVLAQSYDWLLFLTDDGLAAFIEDVLNGDQEELTKTRKAFRASFGRKQGTATRFTKVTIDAAADKELTDYFARAQPWDSWFNVIAPAPSDTSMARDVDSDAGLDQLEQKGSVVTLDELKKDLHALRDIHERASE